MSHWISLAPPHDRIGWGLLRGDSVVVHDAAPWRNPSETGERCAIGAVRLLAPVQPRCFLGLWNNFHAMAAKTGAGIPEFPLYFLKSPGSLLDPERGANHIA